MVNMLPSMVAPFLPILWIGIACALWWRDFSSPLLFATAGLLALFGLQAVVSFMWDVWPQITANHFLQRIVTEAEMQRHLEEQNRTAIMQAVLLLLVGFPFLRWLRNGMSAQSA